MPQKSQYQKFIEEKYFILFANCILVKGAKRAVICDLQKNKITLIPNDLYRVLKRFKNSTIGYIINHYGEENRKIILSYFKLLEDNEYIFYTTDKNFQKNFPKINLQWDSPSIVSNAIIDFDERNINGKNFKKILYQLDELNLKFIQLRYYSYKDKTEILQVISLFKYTGITYIELILKWEKDILDSEFITNLKKELRLKRIVFYDAPVEDYKKFECRPGEIIQIKNHILSEKCCGKISPDNFIANISLFSEGQKYNTCLNKKLGIDVNGDIKNCPSMKITHGNINHTNISKVVENEEFKKIWNVNKDAIDTCKNCEFRYVCTDCRAYIENPEDIYSKPLKCGYDPNTCEWEEWSKNPLKQKSIACYKLI